MNPVSNTSDNSATVRVLVADADADARSLYEDLLAREGYTVVGAANGRDALVNALSERPALLVTETQLAVLDGYGLCDVLRHYSATETVPILVVTSETRIAKLEQALTAGADAVLNKPVSPEALLTEVQRLLAQPPHRPALAPPGLERQRLPRVKAHLRERTTTPPAQPPSLICPSCDRRLYYEHSYVGGVSSRHAEQWDAFTCPGACGRFEYRQRTRKLRRVG